MNTPTQESYYLPRRLRSWEQFWFAPADPTLLALIRISCGMIVVYTMIVYSFRLQEFMGVHAWHDLQMQRDRIDDIPVMFLPLHWNEAGVLPPPKGEFQTGYVQDYRKKWGNLPPPPYPTTDAEIDYLDRYRLTYQMDLRNNGLKRIPETKDEMDYVEAYTKIMRAPPPAFPKDDKEAKEIADYIQKWGADPRRLYSKGQPLFSLWFHVIDPTAMAVVHGIIIAVSIFFMIGFCTRITAPVMWFASLCYIHRNPSILFGVDTMMTILLFYLMMGPCGANWSIDRLIAKWWVTAKPGVVAWWYGLWKQPVPGALAPADPVPETAAPSVAANVVIRLLQIHVCIIYLFAGVSKLQGQTWWNGSAIWFTLGNYEFAPMQFELYMMFLRFIGERQLLYDAFMTGGGLFTLVFEIGYGFLVWRPRLRWAFLGAAILLHGGIGLLMGLKTFSLMMLVMNMAFLRKEEALWILSAPGRLFASRAVETPAKPTPVPAK
ncbi:MAG: hypothetical protein HY289_14665 [Planctomycetes bacterium]|nr:hypothetical protein [Planctomycetota bacterium]